MAAKEGQKVNGAERLLAAKSKLIVRLRSEIKNVRADAEAAVGKIEGRIRIAEALVSALKKGTLKP